MKYSSTTILPNNFLAEQAILNILLTNPSTIQETLSELKSHCFYFEPHRKIYETISELSENNISITLTTLIEKLQDKNYLKKIGGIDQIIKIINRFENFADLSQYIKQVNEKYLRRLIIELGKQFITWGYTTSENLDSILDKMEQAVYSLNQQKISQKIYTVAEIVDEVFSELKEKIKKPTNLGLKTSFKDLDSIIQGFQKSDLIIIAGRPSMGKTAFSLNLGKNIVEKYDIPLIIFTLEMSRQQIIYRLISTTSRINTNRLKSGKMTAEEWRNLGSSMKQIADLPIFIDDNPNLTLMEIRSKLRQIFPTKGKQGLVIIDYLQLMKLNFKLENRVQEISYLTRNFKILAKEFEIPIIVLSQLSRNVESRINKRPMLSDLRESGCLATSKKIFSNQLQSWSINNLVKNKAQAFNLKGMKPIFDFNFFSNHKIILTSNHKILTKKGWQSISQLSKQENYYSIQKKKTNQYNYYFPLGIKYQGIMKVYDKMVPSYHNYILKKLVLHNSIEQDADIVIMIYREDYYNEKIEKTNIHLTEFIVAKHRNGPVGTAKLLFHSLNTSFSDYSE